MAFFIGGQVIVQLTDFIGYWLFKPSCCLLKWEQFESTAISRLCSQLEFELFVRTYVVGANSAVVLLTAFANRCWSLGLMFGDWLMLWLKLTILFSKAYSIHLLYAIHFTMLDKAKRLIESFWVKSANWSKLTKHRKTLRNEAVAGKSVRSRNLCANVICPNVLRHTHKKVSASVRRLTELDSKVFLWIDNTHRANCPFHLH